jgi:hypothetical protein
MRSGARDLLVCSILPQLIQYRVNLFDYLLRHVYNLSATMLWILVDL